MNFARNRNLPVIQQEPELPRELNKKTVDFMDHHHDLEKKVHDQAVQLGHCAVETATQRCQIEFLEAQLAKVRLDCRMYMQGYFALHGKIGAFAKLGSETMKGLANAAVNMLEHVNEEMRAAGIMPPDPEKNADETAEQCETVTAAERQE